MYKRQDTLVIDLEARSKVDIKHGIYRYVSDPSFKILINAAKLNDQPTQVYVNNQEENLPPWVVQRLLDPLTLKVAHNANFERVALSKVLPVSYKHLYYIGKLTAHYCISLHLQSASLHPIPCLCRAVPCAVPICPYIQCQ